MFRIPGAGGDVSVAVLLKSRASQYSIDVQAPPAGKAKSRINWLLAQLAGDDVPDDLVVKVNWGYGRFSQGRMGDLRDRLDRLLWDANAQAVEKKNLPHSFSLQWTRRLPGGRGRSTAAVLEGVAAGLEDFYRRVVEAIRPFVAKAPQLPRAQPENANAHAPR